MAMAELVTRPLTVTVVITTCAQPDRVLRCIDSIFAGELEPLEIVIVENRPPGSSTRERIAARFGTDARVRYVDEPRRGLSQARNTGLRLARGELTVFTDDDIVAGPGWLHAIADAFADPEVGCVTGRIEALALATS